MSKREEHAQRQAELTAAYLERNRLRSNPQAQIDDIVACDARISRLEAIVQLLNQAAQKEATTEASRAKMMDMTIPVETWQAKLKGVQDRRKLLDANKIVAEAEKRIRDVTRQDAELAELEALYTSRILEFEAVSVV